MANGAAVSAPFAARPLRILFFAAFLTFFDRALMPVHVVSAAGDIGISAGDAGKAVAAYALAYGIGQVAWGVIASRFSIIAATMIGNFVSICGALITAVAPDAGWLVVGRIIGGVGFSVLVLAGLLFIGDSLPFQERVPAAAQLAAALSLGMTAGTLVGAGLAAVGMWRWSYVVVISGLLVLTILLRQLRGPRSAPVRVLWSFVRIFSGGWTVAILVLTLLEGALLVGVVSYVPAVLESAGYSTVAAGVIAGLFGVSVIITSWLVPMLVKRVSDARLLLLAGLSIAFGFAAPALQLTPITVSVCMTALGFAWSVGHTQLQAWMTDASEGARPIGMSVFGLALFGGAAMGTVGAIQAMALGSTLLFAVSAVTGLGFALAASVLRASYRVASQQ